MATRTPKTAKGMRNKILTGDGRKNPTLENMYAPNPKKKKIELW